MPTLYIISGCNGAGKTTASYTILPEMLNCHEFVNADEIAKGLSPFQPEKSAIEAGRLMLHRIYELIKRKIDFAFETTLAAKSYAHTVKKAKENDYNVALIYFWLNTPDLAIERIKNRVSQGGHNIGEDVIRRRYKKGLENLFDIFIPICDYWLVIDNSQTPFIFVAEGEELISIRIHNESIWNNIKSIKNE
ncbi:MAG: zeta toxin family protein [Bacteroidota bacterium]